ncbi:Serine/threonine protein phosphatase PrpC [Arboricoccus pini]|uniref:Serine/threonine protein phosphatase PrpC n=1 Tax=Arboricoccus pini TaxID=1963835 RepID=A0A212RQI1_9PROT|nr:PP2C family serine/threonine-protein phosphatase [Arboricoccus pini]SNB74722.1 Serine/threonine protein phosphatase PrpC [Arboricoccus pini]
MTLKEFPDSVGKSIRAAGDTHRGRVRQANEDAYLCRSDIGLWVVADGIGGLSGGGSASRAIVEELGRLAIGPGLAARAEARLRGINNELYEQGGGQSAATVVALIREGEEFVCLWAGDSRLYRLRGDFLTQITSDHTPVQEAIAAGLLKRDDAGIVGLDHIVSRAVGVALDVDLDRLTGMIQPGDVFLLCTDGLSKTVAEASLIEHLADPDPRMAVGLLIGDALDQGGPDNVTAVVVRVALKVEPQRAAVPKTLAKLSAPCRVPARVDAERGRRVHAWGRRLCMMALLAAIFTSGQSASIMQMSPGSNLALADTRQALLLWAELAFVLAAAVGFVGRRYRALALVSALLLLAGLGVVTIAVTDIGDPAMLAAHLPRPDYPLPLARLSKRLYEEVHPWLSN